LSRIFIKMSDQLIYPARNSMEAEKNILYMETTLNQVSEGARFASAGRIREIMDNARTFLSEERVEHLQIQARGGKTD
jgi:hypothetical protein